MVENKYRVALFKVRSGYHNDLENTEEILSAMTNFEEVTEEELALLEEWCNEEPQVLLIQDKTPEIHESMAQILEEVRERVKKKKERANKRAAADAKRAASREANKIERKRKQVAKLKKELGEC